MDPVKPFVVVKFPKDGEEDEFEYEVGLTAWLENVVGEKCDAVIRWPPAHIDASKLVMKQNVCKSNLKDWAATKCFVKKYYSEYLAANRGCNRRIDDTSYETPTEEGRGYRVRRPNPALDSDEEIGSRPPNKKQKPNPNPKPKPVKTPVPAPPAVKRFEKSQNSKSSGSQVVRQDGKFVRSPTNQASCSSYKVVVSKNETTFKSRSNVEGCKEVTENTGQFRKVCQSAKLRDASKLKIVAQRAIFQEEQKRMEEKQVAEQGLLNKLESFNKNKLKKKKFKRSVPQADTKDRKEVSSQSERENSDQDFDFDSSSEKDLIYSSDKDSDHKNDNSDGGDHLFDLSSPVKSLQISRVPISPTSESVNPQMGRISSDVTEDGDKGSPPGVKQSSPINSQMGRISPDVTEDGDNGSPSGVKQSSPISGTVQKPMCVNCLDCAENSPSAGDIPTLSKMYALQKKLNSKQDIMGMSLERLCRFVLPGEKVLKRPEGLGTIPVPDMALFEKMEEFLSDELHRSSASLYISKFSPKDNFKKAVTSLLLNTVSKEVAKHFTFTGVGEGKGKFESTHMWSTIVGALLVKYSEDEVLEAGAIAGKWLTAAAYTRKEKDTGSSSKNIHPSSHKTHRKSKSQKSPVHKC